MKRKASIGDSEIPFYHFTDEVKEEDGQEDDTEDQEQED